jgi:hypothetical protein
VALLLWRYESALESRTAGTVEFGSKYEHPAQTPKRHGPRGKYPLECADMSALYGSFGVR